jgi:hyperosmotically inducible periplasmic protein
MNSPRFRNLLIAASVALPLGIGIAACSKPDDSARNASAEGVSKAITATGDAARSAVESARITGESATQAMSDSWITAKVRSVLLADPEAQGFEVSVDTKDGVVTLGGTLQSQAAIDHVKALAGEVEGVTRVDAAALTVART